MKIVKGRIKWLAEYSNSPKLELLVDKLPPLEDLRYEKRDNIYYAELGGYVNFFYWDGRHGNGFGGRGFPIKMKDGTDVRLSGPWSNNSTNVNRLGFGPCMDVSITDEPTDFERGYTFFSGAVLASLVQDSLDVIEVPDFLPHTWTMPRKLDEAKAIRFPPGSKMRLDPLPDFPWRKVPATELDRTRDLYFGIAIVLPDGTVWRKPQ